MEAETLELVEILAASQSPFLEQFELRRQPCGPKKIRLSIRNGEEGSGRAPADYGNPDLRDRSPLYETLPATRELIESFPLEDVARILVLVDPAGWGTPLHRDHQLPDVKQEFVWFRTSPEKQLYVIDDADVRADTLGFAAWFDSRQRHGVEQSPHPTVSIRVDGRFKADVRENLLASITPSLELGTKPT
ncbi:hypothetical protein [Neorhizobium sp. JUb45]|uniref:hypothetical protein n=1 Tax=Neorhizobium sp. JUb45 TaxID=2485113 RepID=UPI001050FACD|nr:hypothetical protein [Neorhizobium sp. JUb45]